MALRRIPVGIPSLLLTIPQRTTPFPFRPHELAQAKRAFFTRIVHEPLLKQSNPEAIKGSTKIKRPGRLVGILGVGFRCADKSPNPRGSAASVKFKNWIWWGLNILNDEEEFWFFFFTRNAKCLPFTTWGIVTKSLNSTRIRKRPIRSLWKLDEFLKILKKKYLKVLWYYQLARK